MTRIPKWFGNGPQCHKLLIGYTHLPSKLPPPVERSPNPNYLPHPWTQPTYHPKLHPYSISCFATVHRTDRPTDGWRERSTIICRLRWRTPRLPAFWEDSKRGKGKGKIWGERKRKRNGQTHIESQVQRANNYTTRPGHSHTQGRVSYRLPCVFVRLLG